MGWLSYALEQAELERCKTDEEREAVRIKFEESKVDAMMDAILEARKGEENE